MEKDLFSQQSEEYAKYRPVYPQSLYQAIYSHVVRFDRAWDCATGNGQAAVELVKKFKHVDATDLSANQIKYAKRHSNITYEVCQAEKTSFPSNSFDLVTVAQALHWFDFEQFYPELKRVLRDDGLFAAWTYDLCEINPQVDLVLDWLYNDILRDYWDSRRRLIDEKYETLPFPLNRISTAPLKMQSQWTFDHFIHYLETWSAVQSYKEHEGSTPLELVVKDIKAAWGGPKQIQTVTWPIYLLLGR